MHSPAITHLLQAWTEGDRNALNELTPLLYEELHRLAERCMRGESTGHTLQTTALVHEAYERLVGVDLPWRNRAHFLGMAAQIMRRILVDHARRRNSLKRGVDYSRVSLDEALEIALDTDEVVLDLDAALAKLSRFDELKSRILEMRFFGGLTYEEAAGALEISTSELDRELRLAKAWLRHQLEAA
ncbi:MAG: RNA polymerase subunit sigma-70 [Proteobacteria bacterium]|nr:MAG: RNA polymerase subunit sigma-70 [Pseudomonadota bacterium]